jgi:tRNA(Ile)-lysidine synthase
MADVRRAVRSGFEAAGVAAGDAVLVACSGGADSLALAAATQFEGRRAGISVGAVVVEHGLQEATKAVAEETRMRLEELGLSPVNVIPVTVSQAGGSVDGGTEAAARSARYQALETAARELGSKAVLLGHTLNDQAETVLLGLARGSGMKSIAGMRTFTESGLGFVWLRPLLEITRLDTETFCQDSGLAFWVDPHNSVDDFARVRVRNSVLPAAETALGPGVAEALARTASLVQDDVDYLEAVADESYRSVVKLGPTGITASASGLEKLPAAIRGRVVHRILSVFEGTPAKIHVDEVLQLILNWHGQKELTLPGVRVVRHGDDLTFKSSKTLRPGAC